MGLEGLTELQIFQGFIGLVSLIITFIIALKIISKYFTYKQIELLTIGLMMIFISSAWWGSNIAFVLYVFFNIEISDVLYIFISFGFIWISLLLWMYSFAHLVYPQSKRKIVSIFFVISVLYMTFFIIFLTTNTSLIATRVGLLDTESGLYVFIFALFNLTISLITNIIFLKHCLKSNDSKIRWKGKLIFISLIIYIIGSIFDSSATINPIALFIVRMILTLSSILSYIGWVMPDRIARWLVKEEN